MILLDKQNTSFFTASRDVNKITLKDIQKTSLIDKTKLINTKKPAFKKGSKAAKLGKQHANHIITEYESKGPNLAQVQNIIIYDIPVAWTMQ